MRRLITRGVLLGFVAGACLAGEARAQNRDGAWEVIPYLGLVRFGSDAVIQDFPGPRDNARIAIDNKMNYGFRFAYHFTKAQMIEYTFSGTGTDGIVTITDITTGFPTTIKSAPFKTDLITAQVGYVYNFFLHRRDKVVGFVTGGAGILNFSTFGQSGDPDVQRALTDLVGDENDLLFNYGAGMRFFGGEKAGLRIDARRIHYSSNNRGNNTYMELAVGITLVLGGA
jgi:hypothetical protein